jgi:hypothetical protein
MASEFLTIEFNADAAIAAMQQAPARTELAVRRALNRALTTGRAEMARRIAQDYGMKVSDAKEAIFTEQATDQRLTVRLVATRKRRPLLDFQAKPTAAGVTFRGLSGRQLVPGAFMVGVQTGHTGRAHQGVFKRRGKARLPIYELHGVSVGEVFNRHRAAVVEVMTESFDKNLTSELKFANADHV